MADDGHEGPTASRKRPSPAAEAGGLASDVDRSDGNVNVHDASQPRAKRQRTTDSPSRPSPTDNSTPAATSDDPYAFPNDGLTTTSGSVNKSTALRPVSPPTTVAKPASTTTLSTAAPAPPPLAAGAAIKRASLPGPDDADAETRDGADSGGGAAVAKPEAFSHTVPAVPDRDAKDTPMAGTSESDERSSVSEKKPAAAATAQLVLPQPGVKLRQPQKLKRLREQHEREQEGTEQRQRPKAPLSDYEQAHQGLRRVLALALSHVGFSSATDSALESFLLMTETYIQSLASDVSRFALAGRRSQPIPLDFDVSLARFNIGTGALRPHLRCPIPQTKLVPVVEETRLFDVQAQLEHGARHRRSSFGDLPLLGNELSGKPEKEAKPYIPRAFPDFPSIHTYRHTPVDVDKVTVQGSGLRYDDGTMVLLANEEPSADDRELGLGGSRFYSPNADGASLRNNDPKRIREAAAIEAKQAEAALRGLMRASKVNKLKEVRAAADRNALSKQRYTLWEAAMRELIVEAKQTTGGTKAADAPPNTDASPSAAAKSAAAALREEIADQSMMVNSEKIFHRREIPRKARKVV